MEPLKGRGRRVGVDQESRLLANRLRVIERFMVTKGERYWGRDQESRATVRQTARGQKDSWLSQQGGECRGRTRVQGQQAQTASEV